MDIEAYIKELMEEHVKEGECIVEEVKVTLKSLKELKSNLEYINGTYLIDFKPINTKYLGKTYIAEHYVTSDNYVIDGYCFPPICIKKEDKIAL